jgi:capsular polysaccharide transport system ATP-binding protein
MLIDTPAPRPAAAAARQRAAMIEFVGVKKAYRSARAEKVILAGFTGALPYGRNIGILGMNGAGKSTLLRLIAGTEFPDAGKIRRYARISYPLGFTAFKGNMTGRENSRFVARIYGLDVKSVERFVEEFAELGKYFDMPVSTYSSGMTARVSFAVSMAVDFEVYLIDEMLGVGDKRFKARAEAIFDAKRERANLIMVSHSTGTLQRFCDMGAILYGGELALYDDLADAIKDYDALFARTGGGA